MSAPLSRIAHPEKPLGNSLATPASELLQPAPLVRADVLSEALGEDIWDWDLSTDTLWVSEGLAKKLQVSVQESWLTAERFIGAFHPEDRLELTRAVNRTIAAKVALRHQARLWCGSLGYRRVELSGRASAGRNNRTIHLSGVLRPVEDDAVAGMFEQVFQRNPDPVVVLDLNLKAISANPAAGNLFGCSGEEFLGLDLSEVCPNVRSYAEKALEAATRGAEPGQTEVSVLRPGSKLTLSVQAGAIKRDNSLVGICLIARDITAEKAQISTLRQVSAQLLQVQDEERRRLARELHDSTAQTLAVLCIQMESAALGQPKEDSQWRNVVEEGVQLAKQCSQELRTMSYLMHPPLIEQVGLISAVRLYVEGFSKRSGIRTTLVLPDAYSAVSRETETALFRVVQEALSNVVRHSHSASAAIRLRLEDEHLILSISDAGRGIPAELIRKIETGGAGVGVGLVGMKERIRQLGGALTIKSSGRGSRVTVFLPRDVSEE